MNTFGRYFRLTTFGESHGPAIGGIVDGLPAGLHFDDEALALAMARRNPASAAGATQRREPDDVEILSGVYQGTTLGTPIGFIIRNHDARPTDYDAMAAMYRPNHADYTYQARYGIRDPRGGGRASARETACRSVGGALADLLLKNKGIEVVAWAQAIGTVEYNGSAPSNEDIPFATATRCHDTATDAAMQKALAEARHNLDTLGGVVECEIRNMPAGIGEPLAYKLQAMLAHAMMTIPAAKGFEYGDGFAAARAKGSEQIDAFASTGTMIYTTSNHCGGIQGGITNGMPIRFRVVFKPIATIPGRPIPTVDSAENPCTLTATGRHDVCVVPRAVAVVQAMARMAVADALLAPISRV